MNTQVVRELGLSEITVKMRGGAVMRKRQANSLELVRMADTQEQANALKHWKMRLWPTPDGAYPLLQRK